jgi:hypothetical protein
MPLLPEQLHARLTSIYTNTTNNNNSTQLANAIYEYLVPITPPSTGVDSARPALIGLFNGLSGNPDSWYINALNAGLPAYAAAIASGMAPQFTASPPPPTTLPNFAGIFKSNTDAELSWSECARIIADAIHTWFSQGTATDNASGTTINWGQPVPEAPAPGAPGSDIKLNELPGFDTDPPKAVPRQNVASWPTTYLSTEIYTDEDDVFTSQPTNNPTRQWLRQKGISGDSGQLSASDLVSVSTRGNVIISASDPRVIRHAVPWLYGWMDEISSVGAGFTISSMYRSYADQERVYQKYKSNPGQAAPAGKSNHGWGIAVDISDLYIDKGTKKYAIQQAMRASNKWKLIAGIGKKYNWYLPYLLRDDAGTDETWHFEYWGPAPAGDATV